MTVSGPRVVAQIHASDLRGGAARIATDLHRGYQARGIRSFLLVGRKYGDDPTVRELPHLRYRALWTRAWTRFLNRGSGNRSLWVRGLRRVLAVVADPRSVFEAWMGWDPRSFPASAHVLDLVPERPDILHFHNLHGGYFDLRVLPDLSHRVPLVVTLHDAWMFTGHCAHFLDCTRWLHGCGRCPDLALYPALRRDATARNWRVKARAYRRSRLYVATPCTWLADQVRRSMLMPAIVELRVIHHGVDVNVFSPGPAAAARAELGLPQDQAILLVVSHGLRKKSYRDFLTIRRALQHMATAGTQPVLCLALGEEAPAEQWDNVTLRYIPRVEDPVLLARYYRAADVYLHAARADTFPNTILEAMACGVPVVATAVGGIPEQVVGYPALDMGIPQAMPVGNPASLDRATGVLVPAGDAGAMAQAAQWLLREPAARRQMGENAARRVRHRYTRTAMVNAYLDWYHEILERASAGAPAGERVPT